ncbi:MAG: hypothetical protein ACXADB_08600, partial [Candidatus Hermodarchaeia archaeon]|jgi:hypothetical protein
VKELFSIYFSDFKELSHDLESELFEYSIKFAVDSINASDLSSTELWIQIFSRMAIRIEWEIIREINSTAGNDYVRRLQENKNDLPHGKVIYRSKNLLEGFLSNEADFNTFKRIDPTINSLLESIFDLLRELFILSKRKSKPERYDQYIRNIQERKSGLIFSIPELAKHISEKVNNNRKLARKYINKITG